MFTMLASLKRRQITDSNLNKKPLWVCLVVLIFIVFRLSPFFWDNISSISSYLIEVLFVAFIYTLYKPKIKFQKDNVLKYGFLFVILGACSFLGAKGSGIIIPFDFSHPRDILSLLLIAPILEEFLFRFAYWDPFNKLFKSNKFTLIFTSLLFSISHFVAYFYLPVNFHDFVFYQSFYTLILGFFLGLTYIKTHNLLYPILFHFYFNLSFYVTGVLIKVP